jgi:hypothetical protein
MPRGGAPQSSQPRRPTLRSCASTSRPRRRLRARSPPALPPPNTHTDQEDPAAAAPEADRQRGVRAGAPGRLGEGGAEPGRGLGLGGLGLAAGAGGAPVRHPGPGREAAGRSGQGAWRRRGPVAWGEESRGAGEAGGGRRSSRPCGARTAACCGRRLLGAGQAPCRAELRCSPGVAAAVAGWRLRQPGRWRLSTPPAAV